LIASSFGALFPNAQEPIWFHQKRRETAALKIGGDLDNKKARSEKQALLEQYAILCNTLGSADKVSIPFATAYNRFGEGAPGGKSGCGSSLPTLSF
jgi:hypothetical protein